MKRIWYFLVLLAGMTVCLRSVAQSLPQDVCRIENGEIIFKLDLNWNAEQKENVAGLFGLDSITMAMAFNNVPEFTAGGMKWKTRKIGDHLVELSKSLKEMPVSKGWQSDILIMDDKWLGKATAPDQESVILGANMFSEESVFRMPDGTTKFSLRNHKTAGHVYLSGSFNNWSTMMTPMKVSPTGWEADLSLLPGKYLYKFIVDGNWTPDPSNLFREKDGRGGYNSVYFVTNHTFRLNGHEDAGKVFLAGSFNNWNDKQYRMRKTSGGWELPVYLKEGTHAYKFVVDKNWILDPGNLNVRPDGHGNTNSFMSIGDTGYFRLEGYPLAKKVVLTGSFNGWSQGELIMNKVDSGWEIPYVLAPGNYEYKFIVDNHWIIDPLNPYTTGSGDYMNSFLALKPNHVFSLNQFPAAKKVIVTGSFNGWNTGDYRMIREGNRWIFPIHLKPGKCTYKFLVDGVWMIDPMNELWENNEVGTGNSILWIEP